MKNCNHSLQDYHDKIANYDCVVCYLEQILRACKSLIQNADLDESPKANIDSSGWTKSVWVTRKDLISIETAIRKAKGDQ